jgi:hypothetical protein
MTVTGCANSNGIMEPIKVKKAYLKNPTHKGDHMEYEIRVVHSIYNYNLSKLIKSRTEYNQDIATCSLTHRYQNIANVEIKFDRSLYEREGFEGNQPFMEKSIREAQKICMNRATIYMNEKERADLLAKKNEEYKQKEKKRQNVLDEAYYSKLKGFLKFAKTNGLTYYKGATKGLKSTQEQVDDTLKSITGWVRQTMEEKTVKGTYYLIAQNYNGPLRPDDIAGFWTVVQPIHGGYMLRFDTDQFNKLPNIMLKTDKILFEGHIVTDKFVALKFGGFTTYQTVIGSMKQAIILKDSKFKN